MIPLFIGARTADGQRHWLAPVVLPSPTNQASVAKLERLIAKPLAFTKAISSAISFDLAIDQRPGNLNLVADLVLPEGDDGTVLVELYNRLRSAMMPADAERYALGNWLPFDEATATEYQAILPGCPWHPRLSAGLLACPVHHKMDTNERGWRRWLERLVDEPSSEKHPPEQSFDVALHLPSVWWHACETGRFEVLRALVQVTSRRLIALSANPMSYHTKAGTDPSSIWSAAELLLAKLPLAQIKDIEQHYRVSLAVPKAMGALAERNQAEKIQYLLDQGACTPHRYESEIRKAAMSGAFDAWKLLVDRDFRIHNHSIYTSSYRALCRSNREDYLAVLEKRQDFSANIGDMLSQLLWERSNADISDLITRYRHHLTRENWIGLFNPAFRAGDASLIRLIDELAGEALDINKTCANRLANDLELKDENKAEKIELATKTVCSLKRALPSSWAFLSNWPLEESLKHVRDGAHQKMILSGLLAAGFFTAEQCAKAVFSLKSLLFVAQNANNATEMLPYLSSNKQKALLDNMIGAPH